MKVSVEENSAKTPLTYPCLVRVKYDGTDLILLAFNQYTSTVMESSSETWSVGEQFDNHGKTATLFEGTITLTN